jgi:outer membrane usher protein
MKRFLMAAALCLSIVVPQRALAATETLLLDVRLNGRPIGKIAEFTLIDGKLFSRAKELKELGLKTPEPLAEVSNDGAGDDQVALTALSGLTYHLDLAAQTIELTVADGRIVPTVLRNGGVQETGVTEASGTGATLDYDMVATLSGGRPVGAGLLGVRVFSPVGVGSMGMLVHAGGFGGTSAIRLDTSFTMSNPETLRRVRVGDFISGSLAWTRPVRFAGAQVSIDFGLRPDLITFPLPSINGSATVPSTIDVLVNGTRQFTNDIEAGPFEIPQLPVVTGAGTIRTVVTNALGRQVTTTLPFYASAALLSPGLQTYSLQAGVVRRNYGLLSNDYRKVAASGTYRRGLSTGLTIEATTEATSHLGMAGAGAVLNVANLAILNASAAISQSDAGLGRQFAIGVQRSGTVLSLNASISVADRKFRDIAAANGDAVARLQISAGAGLVLGRFGAVGVAYVGIERDATLPDDNFIGPLNPAEPQSGINPYLQRAQRTHVLSASYSVQLGRLSVFATSFHAWGGGGTGILAGVSIPFGKRGSASVNMGASGGGITGQVQASRTAAEIGDFGYQFSADAGASGHQFAEGRYKASWSTLSAGIDRSGSTATVRAQAQGSLSFLGGSMFASNTIYDSFAIVDTDGLANVRVRQENRDVGTTSARGRLLVPDLRSFEVNHLSIDPTDVPVDATLETSVRNVRVQDRSGVVIHFPVKVSSAALLRLVDVHDAPIPMGSTARLTDTGAVVPVGFDGQAYIVGLAAHNEVTVEAADGRHCTARFDYQRKAGDIPVIGPVKCLEKAA